MKKLILAVLAALFIVAPVSAAVVIPPHTEQFYVNDFANVLSSETRDKIFETSRKLDSETGAQIVVATIESLDGSDIETYANKMFRDWRLGDSEKNSGLLLLVSRDDRRMRIEVGYGLEGILPDGKVGRIRDEYITPALREDKWDLGISRGYDALYDVIDQNRDEIGRKPAATGFGMTDWIVISVIAAIVLGIIALAIYARRHPEKFKDSSPSGSSSGSGGSSSSSGSSSGGGGFSGGGGSSGGGGASGSF